ncbi:MAG: protein tyrosine kinase [Desulfuromonas sp.]|nr:MAG: protein tyrosine kinase [Desulfuromonas sp.]
MNEYRNHPGPPRTEEVHLQDYLNVLFRRRKYALATFLAIVILVVLYTFLTRPVFEAAATLHVQDEKVKGGGDLLGDLGLSRDNPIETEVEILKSRTNTEEVVRRLQLNWGVEDTAESVRFNLLEFTSQEEEPEYLVTLTKPGHFTVRGKSWQSAVPGQVAKLFQHAEMSLLIDALEGEAGDTFTLILKPFNATVRSLRSTVNASEVGKGTNIIRLSYQNTDPRLASDIVNTLATVYLDRNIVFKTEEARKSVEFISQQLDDVRQLLDEAEDSLQDFKSQSGIIRLDTEAETLIGQLTMADKEKNAYRLHSRQAEFAINALQEAIRDGKSYAPSSLLDDPVLAELAKELARLEVERMRLLADFTEAHPSVQQVNSQIAEAQRRMLATYQSLQDGYRLRIRDLDKEIARFEKKLKGLPEAEQQLVRLTRLATVNADIYTFLLQKHEEARIARAATISSINIIDPAIVPDTPIKPNKKKNLLLALIVGCMAGIGVAFFLEYLDDTIKDAESARQVLDVPVLSVIPFISPRNGNGDDESSPDKIKRTLITHLEPRSPAAEAFRTLRTGIHFSSFDEEKKVILVTSSFPGEGKTTVAANLAETMAKTGSKVLLIGCDLRRPSLHTIFDQPRSPGLTEVLIDDSKLEDAIHRTGINKLDFISAGMTPPNPAELIGSSRMQEVLDELKVDYDTIILDAPPLLAVTDSSLLSVYATMAVVVLEAGRVQVRALQRMKELLESLQIKVAGMVLNDKSGKGMEYYSYYRDRYGKYGYGQYGYYSSGYDSDAPPAKKSLLDKVLWWR